MSDSFELQSVFFTGSLMSGISFLTALRAAVVAKPSILGISALVSLILAS